MPSFALAGRLTDPAGAGIRAAFRVTLLAPADIGDRVHALGSIVVQAEPDGTYSQALVYDDPATAYRIEWVPDSIRGVSPPPFASFEIPAQEDGDTHHILDLYETYIGWDAPAVATAAPVQSVAGRTGAVVLTQADVAGTVATTDPRLSDARTPTAHTHTPAQAGLPAPSTDGKLLGVAGGAYALMDPPASGGPGNTGWRNIKDDFVAAVGSGSSVVQLSICQVGQIVSLSGNLWAGSTKTATALLPPEWRPLRRADFHLLRASPLSVHPDGSLLLPDGAGGVGTCFEVHWVAPGGPPSPLPGTPA